MFTSFSAVANCFRRAVPVAIIAALGLTACGGGGGAGYGGGGTTAPAGTSGSKLFVGDYSYIASLVNTNPANGQFLPDRSFYGTDFSSVLGIALDAVDDRLYLGTSSKVSVYNNASTTSGFVSAARVITGLGIAGSLFIDTANNSLYVGDIAGVNVFFPADTASDAATPSRSITGPFGASFEIDGVAVDAGKNILYVSSRTSAPSTSNQITLFTASTANGLATPKATITPVDGMANNLVVGSIALDSAHDRLYVAGPPPTVMVFDQVSGLSGAQTATRTITLTTGQVLSLAIDTVNDRLYAASFGIAGGFLYIVQGASAALDTPASMQTLTPYYTNFTAVAVKP